MDATLSRVGRRLLAVCAAAAVLGVAACGSGSGAPTSAAGATHATSPPPTSTPTRTPAPSPGLAAVAADPQAGLSGALLQFRRNVEARRVQIRLTAANDGLVVEAVTLEAAGLPAAPGDPREAQLWAGAALDFPVVLGRSDCATSPGRPQARVRLRDASGARREVRVPLDDGGLARLLHDRDCADQALTSQVAFEVADIQEVDTADGPGLHLTVRLRRIGGSDDVRVTGLGSNTVYTITAAGSFPTLGDGVETLDLLLVPARCDVHALGESYRTSLIGLVVALGDAPPRPFVLTPEPAVRRQLETFAVETCRSGQ